MTPSGDGEDKWWGACNGRVEDEGSGDLEFRLIGTVELVSIAKPYDSPKIEQYTTWVP